MTDPNRTLIVGLLDRSGSMSRIKSDVVGAWTSFIEQQKNADLGDDVFVSLYQFDRDGHVAEAGMILETVYELKAIAEVPELDLVPRGVTPLLDAVGLSITRVGRQLADLDENQRPGRVYFAILTDGYENASLEYDLPTVKRLVTEHQDVWKWEFHFIGAGIDAFQAGYGMGMSANTTYVADATGPSIRKSYGAMGQSIVSSRSKR